MAVTSPHLRTYTAADGYRLHYRHWQPSLSPPRARIVALHGIQSHSGWFTYSCGRLCEAGFEVFFLDRRGSGMNESGRGDAADEMQLIDDVARTLTSVRESSPGSGTQCPVILLGVSWGGKLAAAVAARRPELVDGLALLYPGLCARVRPRWDQNARLWLADRLGLHSRRVRVPLDDPALFTGDPRWQDFIRTDPLALHEVTVSFLLANRALDRFLPAIPSAVRCPVMVMLAGRDEIIDNEATRKYVSQFASDKNQVVEYASSRHTLEFEPDRDCFVNDLIRWLETYSVR